MHQRIFDVFLHSKACDDVECKRSRLGVHAVRHVLENLFDDFDDKGWADSGGCCAQTQRPRTCGSGGQASGAA